MVDPNRNPCPWECLHVYPLSHGSQYLLGRGLHRQGGSKNEGCLGLDLYAVLTKIEGREERQVEDGGRTPSV